MKEAKTKLEELQKRGGDVTADDVKDLHGDAMGAGGQGGMGGVDLDKVEKCYKDNNANPPALLGIAKNVQSGGNGGLLGLFKGSQPKVTQAQLRDMHDALDEKIKHPDCGC